MSISALSIRSEKLELMSMPTEIHYHLHSFLDHPSLLNLSATSKYFRALCPETKVKESLVCLEKCSLETDTILTKKSLLPCYICKKGLDSFANFPPLRPGQSYSLACSKASRRVCATCLFRTRPELIQYFDLGVPGNKGNDWVFRHYTPDTGTCQLYIHRYAPHDHRDHWWLKCSKCNTVKRYQGSPHSRRVRYNEAMMKGDMCGACYQPVWDGEDEERRLKKNARGRELYYQKKEEKKKKAKEAAEREERVRGESMTSIAAMDLTRTTPVETSGLEMVQLPRMNVPIADRDHLQAPDMDFSVNGLAVRQFPTGGRYLPGGPYPIAAPKPVSLFYPIIASHPAAAPSPAVTSYLVAASYPAAASHPAVTSHSTVTSRPAATSYPASAINPMDSENDFLAGFEDLENLDLANYLHGDF